jgi:hypothetical protein
MQAARMSTDNDATWDTTPAARPVRVPASGFDDAMQAREVAAMRGFVRLVMALAACVLAAAPFLAFDRMQWVALTVGLATCVGGAAWTLPKLRRGRLDSSDVAVIAVACMLGGSAGIFTFGFFSPAPLATIMGVFFFGLQRNRRVAQTVFALTCVVHGTVMILQTFGVIADHGVISAEDVSRRHRLITVGLVETVFFLTFFLARATQRAIVASARQLEESTRALAQREALLDEARRELERVLEVGGPGRFTEQRLGMWELGVLCGRGAMGDVYVATHVQSGRRAAVKLLTRDSARDPDSVRRFLREARIAASIDMPNVVRVLEVGSDDAAVPFIAMELLEGKDLASILRKERRLGGAVLLDMLRQVARGLDAAHDAGVVHRDLKPQNIYLAEGVWKILDFGVSRLIDVDSSLTRGQAIGTPSYMSPEQARGHLVDRHADIFALGVLAYRAMTGQPPFGGSEVPQILYRVVYGMPPRPSELVNVPGAVDEVLAIALAKLPGDRFTSATELVDALDAALDGRIALDHRDRARRLTSRLPWGREIDLGSMRTPPSEITLES